MRPHRLALLSLVLLLPLSGWAQPAKRALTAEDFDSWRSIATPLLSRDGRWLAYSDLPQDADGTLVIREVSGTREQRIPVGSQPPPAPSSDEGANPEAPPARRNIRILFSGDSRYVVASTFPARADVAAARAAKKKPEEMPRDGMVIVRLDTGEVTRIADVKGFQVPSRAGGWFAYQRAGKPGESAAEEGKSDAGTDAAAGGGRRPGGSGGRGGAPGSEGSGGPAGAGGNIGSDLVVRHLESGRERTWASVGDFLFSRDGRSLAFAVSSRTRSENGVYVLAPEAETPPETLLAGEGRYSRLAWDREQTQLAFLSDRDSVGTSGGQRYTIYHWARSGGELRPAMRPDQPGLPKGLVVSGTASPAFSRDGRRLLVSAAKAPAKARPAPAAAASAMGEEKVVADLWHWREGFVPPMQKVRAGQDRNRTFRGVLDLAGGTYVQLADEQLPTVSLSDDARRALGYDDQPYRTRVDFDGRYADVYVVDTATGARRQVLSRMRSESGPSLSWSPDGRWAAYYQGKQWHVLNLEDGTSRSLTAGLDAAFHNEEDDRPAPPPAHGAAGWTKDSASWLAYDRYDVWQLFVDGRPARNVTGGQGRAGRLILRVQRTEAVEEDDEERGVDPAKPLILRGEDEATRATGFLRGGFAEKAPLERLVWGERNHRYVGRARDAEVLLFTASRFDEYPDLQVADGAFGNPRRVTDLGSQLAPFAWGRSELMSFRNADGVPLQAAVFLPAGFDPAKKYPAMVYIYERLSQGVHTFVNPGPGTSINPSFYTSNGYVVLMPDIVYRTGQPGQSAVRCVLPALDALLARGFVDAGRVGIQGHSWGGYQIAYLLTQTDRFRAAEAGAPVGNMTSAYSGIRWGTGLPRQFQYETGQSRIGRPLEEAAGTFIENSAVFQAGKVTTPLLILHNDNDDAVPWQQGIELFLALRRQGKPAWLFNYNGEFHGLRRRVNQKDWSRRMQQFFDHHLKGEPAPVWLEKGVPFLEREEEAERFNARPRRPVTAAGG